MHVLSNTCGSCKILSRVAGSSVCKGRRNICAGVNTMTHPGTIHATHLGSWQLRPSQAHQLFGCIQKFLAVQKRRRVNWSLSIMSWHRLASSTATTHRNWCTSGPQSGETENPQNYVTHVGVNLLFQARVAIMLPQYNNSKHLVGLKNVSQNARTAQMLFLPIVWDQQTGNTETFAACSLLRQLAVDNLVLTVLQNQCSHIQNQQTNTNRMSDNYTTL